MKYPLYTLALMSVLAPLLHAKIDTSPLFINTEGLRSYCQKKCLDDGDCVEKCMNLDQDDKDFT